MLDNEDNSVNNLINSLSTIKHLIDHSNILHQIAHQSNQTKPATTNRHSNKLFSKIGLLKESSETDLYLNDFTLHNDNDAEGLNSYSADEDEETKYASFMCANQGNSNEIKQSKYKIRRSLPAQFYRRMSNIAWSTTTSANGLPTVEVAPSRQRSLSLKCTGIYSNNNTNQSLISPLYSSYSVSDKADLFLKNKDSFVSNNSELLRNVESSSSEGKAELTAETKVSIKYDYEDEENTPGSSVNSNISCKNKTSDYESGESPTNSDYNSDTDKLQLKVDFFVAFNF